jgi:hypothetical protein
MILEVRRLSNRFYPGQTSYHTILAALGDICQDSETAERFLHCRQEVNCHTDLPEDDQFEAEETLGLKT